MKETNFTRLFPDAAGQVILNIAAGKEQPLDLPTGSYMLINIDSGYYKGTIEASDIVDFHERYEDNSLYREFMVKEDVFRFMEKHPLKFDRIVLYRFLEHVKRTDVLYFIYLMATSLKLGGLVDCIVPNYETLAKRILEEEVYAIDFEQDDIITTYELLNEPESPHCSIWTPRRIKKFFHLEKRFNVLEISPRFDFDGRDIYLRAIIERI